MVRWGTHVKQVANEACSNAKSCKVTMSSPPTLAKNVNEEEKQGNNSQDHDAKD